MNEIMSEAVTVGLLLIPIMNIIVQSIKKAGVRKQLLPILSINIGWVIGLGIALSIQGDVLAYMMAGFMAGGSASGIYDAFQSLKGVKK